MALEPLVRRARSVLGVDVPEDRTVRIADRWLSWAAVGASYAGVVAASRAAEARRRRSSGTPNTDPKWDGRAHGGGAFGGDAGADGF